MLRPARRLGTILRVFGLIVPGGRSALMTQRLRPPRLTNRAATRDATREGTRDEAPPIDHAAGPHPSSDRIPVSVRGVPSGAGGESRAARPPPSRCWRVGHVRLRI